jgi:4-hydroxy-tetrahydrodipicolinate reductase
MGYEIHHNRKKDSPSGTMNMIGKILLEKLKNKKRIVTEKLDRKISEEELHLASVRGGSVPGTHVISFDSEVDTIELKHTVRSRKGLAIGAIKAAEWIKDKKGFYSIEDMMNEIIGG